MPFTDSEKKAMPKSGAVVAEGAAPAAAVQAAPAKPRDPYLVPMYKVEADGTRTEDDIHHTAVAAREANGWKRKEG